MENISKQIQEKILKESKINVKILLISDDFDKFSFETIKELLKEGNYFNSPEHNHYSFDIDLVEDFEDIRETPYLRRYDAFLIDYGIVGDDKDNLEMIKKMTDNFGCVIWCGGLPLKYNDDSKRLFPDREYLHNLPSCSISSDEIIFTLYKNLNNNLAPGEFTLRVMQKTAELIKKENGK